MDRKKEDGAYAYWLYSIPGVGNKGIGRLLEGGKEPKDIFENFEKESEGILPEAVRRKALEFTKEWDVTEEWNKLAGQGIGFAYQGCEGYPERLAHIPDAPYGFFWKGSLPAEHVLTVAVVGARECSAYGKYLAEAVGSYLGSRGIAVVSGMARGVDGIAQKAALDAGGYSAGVLGSGVDICYPRESRDVYDMLGKRGCLISLVQPGTLPRPSLFPPRNRVVSGLADAILVIEAREKSGTLITVDMALDQGREVFAVPGRVTDRLSDGCNRLLKQGAGIFLSPESFERELNDLFPDQTRWRAHTEGGSGRAAHEGETGNGAGVLTREEENLTREEREILGYMDLCPVSIQTLMDHTCGAYCYRQIQNLLLQLCVKGKVRQVSQGYFAMLCNVQ